APLAVVYVFPDVEKLAHLYAIGVVGAITINLSATAATAKPDIRGYERWGLSALAVLMLAIWITIAVTKLEALAFAVIVLALGLVARWAVQHRSELAERLPKPLRKALTPVTEELPEPEAAPAPATGEQPLSVAYYEPRGIVMVAARGGNPKLLQFAVEEARNRQAELRVLFVRQLAVLPMGPEENSFDASNDPEARALFEETDRIAREASVPWRPVYTASDDVAAMIADTASTHGADVLILGTSQRGPLWKAMKGDVIQEVGKYLPENIRLVIHA
ncbi:MAG: universal stress protein, partial [Gemmatales bacterium]|nr:universal stress protein [Gemmatales bacterium]MDW8174831.1 universal stress protein [Gemmatales bacterium]